MKIGFFCLSAGMDFIGILNMSFNRYRRKRPKADASIFDSALSHTRRSDAPEKREENTRVHFGANSSVDKFRVLACIG